MAGSVVGIQQRYDELSPVLNERGRRLFAAAEARAYGPGGVSAVSRITGIARSKIGRGVQEIEENQQVGSGRIRKPGAGRKSKLTEDSTLLTDIEWLVASATRGDPMRPLRWTSKSLRHLSQALQAEGHSAYPHVIADCLHELGYSLQANRKTREVSGHMDRNAQFEYLNDQAAAFLAANEPVISVDTKKKELVGNFKNNGREWRPKATPEAVKVHDFIDPKLGRAVPYGVYDIADNKGWVSVGADHDTASFAVNAIRRWWSTMGAQRYPKASSLLITADGGGAMATASAYGK
jgi:transposase